MSVSDENEIINDTDMPSPDSELGYPVSVYFVELSQLYMHRLRWQWHQEIEVIIINHGEAEFLTDDKKFKVKAGQGIIINQNVIHSLQSLHPDANCSLYSITFHPSFLFGYGNTAMSGKFLVPFLSSPYLRVMLLDEENPLQEKLLDTINNVIAVNLTKKFGYELMSKSYLCQFWLMILEDIIPQNVDDSSHTAVSPDEIRVKNAISYIEKHYSEAITLEQLADSIHISKSECCRCFKRALETSPIEYLMKYRIFKAANLIQGHAPCANSMSELAFSVGFNNASYFNKVFRQFLNCTPSEYKKRLKTDPTKDPFYIPTL